MLTIPPVKPSPIEIKSNIPPFVLVNPHTHKTMNLRLDSPHTQLAIKQLGILESSIVHK